MGVNTSAPRHVRLALLDRFQSASQQVVGLLEPRRNRVDVGFGEFVEIRAHLRGVGHICQQLRDLGTDLIGVGTHLAVYASRFGGVSRDQRSMARRAVSSPAINVTGRPYRWAFQTALAAGPATP